MNNQSDTNSNELHDVMIEVETYNGKGSYEENKFGNIGDLFEDEVDSDNIDEYNLEEPVWALNEVDSDNIDEEIDVDACSNEEVDYETTTYDIEKMEAPKNGMSFDTLAGIEKHLVAYAKQCGFSIRRRNVKPPKKSNRPPQHILWVCSKAGTHNSRSLNKMKPRASQMTNCNAKFNGKELKNRKWMFSTVNLEHNHVLKPEEARYMAAYRKIPKEVEKRIVTNDEAGIRACSTYMAEAVKNHGYQNLAYLERDVRNLLQRKRREKLVGPDSIAMYNYFQRCLSESNNFFFAMDIDAEGRLHNVMWVDARSRAAYKEFNDATGFDTTYLKNRYDMPFAPFIGTNHHGMTILLGCALLSREDTETFRWLFKTWIDCMGGVAPKAIVTDQSAPITRAIELEMPNTTHRWCLWHIMEKQNKKFRRHKEFHEIKSAMSNCVYDSMSVDEFEVSWKTFVHQYGLQENNWLCTLYKERRRWVPTFLNDCFWAGMSTTQRNEGVNFFFKNYVNSKTSLKEFVQKYDLALGEKCEKERLLDHKSRNTVYKVVSKFAVERFFQPLYTHTAFSWLMDEVSGVLYTTPRFLKEEENYCHFEVQDSREYGESKIERRVEYLVRLEKGTNLVMCSCKLFETRGIMCRHSIKVLYDAGIQTIDSSYVVRQWRKDVDRPYTRVKVPYYNPLKCENVARYERMQEEFEKVAITAMNTQEEFGIVMDGIRTINQNLENCTKTNHVQKLSSQQVNQSVDVERVIFYMDNLDGTQNKVALHNPKHVKVAGRPRVSVRRKNVNGRSNNTSQAMKNTTEARKGMNPKKRNTKKNVNVGDEMASSTSELFSTHNGGNAINDPAADFINSMGHDGSFTKLMQFYDQMGHMKKEVGTSYMDYTSS